MSIGTKVALTYLELLADKKVISGFAPSFDGSYFDSPGKGLGQADTGDATFPSSTWMPEGQTDKSVNEDIQLGYPGTAEVPLATSLEQQIKKAFGAEYSEAFVQLANAVQQHKSIDESISAILNNSDYALDESVLKQLAEKYLR